uniref:Ig-like domain-containing protein n=1 Tax=Anopheles melas TaxID=34690 RepID=A0A182U5V3_9DIPT
KKKAEEDAKKKKAEDEAKKKKAEEEAKKKKEEEEANEKKEEEEAKKKKEEEEVKKKVEEEAKKKKEEEVAKKKEEEEAANKKKEEEAVKKKKEKEEAKKKKEEEDAKNKQDEEAAKKKKEEEEVKKKKEEEDVKKKKAEEESKKKAEEEARKKKEEEEEAKKKKEEEEAKKKKEEEEAKKKQEEVGVKKKKAEEEAKKKKEEEDAKKKQNEETAKKKKEEEEVKKKKEEEEAKKKKNEEEAKKKKEEENAKKKKEEEEARKKKEVEETKKKAEAEAKRKKEEEDIKKKKEEEEANKKEKTKKKEEEETKEKEEKEKAKQKKAEAETKKQKEEDEAKKKIQKEENTKKKAEEEKIRKRSKRTEEAEAEAELALSKTSVELQLLQKDLEYIQLNFGSDRVDLTSKTVQSYFVQICKSLTLLHPSVVATVQKPSYATCVNILQQLTIPVHDLVSVLPPSTSAGDAEAFSPALKHNLRQLYRIVSLISQQHLTRVRNEREVTIVEEIKRQLLSLDRLLKALLDLHSKTEQQKDLLEMVRKNLATLKSVMLQVRTTCCLQTLVEKDDQLLGAFELVIERLTVNPLQLDSVEYLRLLAESLERYCDVMRRLGNTGTISDWLLRYQLQLLKIFDTIEFCLSEEQFIVIGSKEKYTRTSTQDAIHAVKQLITHYKIASSQEVRREQKSEQTHIQLIAARQGLTDEAESVTGGGRERSARRTVDGRQSRADAVRRHATRSPVGQRDDPPRSSSRCSLGALPSKRGPSFAVYLKNVFIERDHSFKLLCVVLDSEIDVRWTKDGSDIAPTRRYHMVQKNGLITLQVDHAEYEDTGVYACHVFNNYGQSFNKCTVEVYDTSDDIICPSFSIPHQMVVRHC